MRGLLGLLVLGALAQGGVGLGIVLAQPAPGPADGGPPAFPAPAADAGAGGAGMYASPDAAPGTPAVPPDAAPLNAPPPPPPPPTPPVTEPAPPVAAPPVVAPPVAEPPVAEPPPAEPQPAQSTLVGHSSRKNENEPSWLGAGVDVGLTGPLPDLGVLIAYQPTRWLKLGAGAGTNLIGIGIKGSVTLVNPLVIPLSLTGEIGHYFQADANPAVRRFASQEDDVASLKHVGYDYANLLVGLEGGKGSARLYLRAGATLVRARVSSFEETLRSADVAVTRTSDPAVSYAGPTLKLGLFIFFQ